MIYGLMAGGIAVACALVSLRAARSLARAADVARAPRLHAPAEDDVLDARFTIRRVERWPLAGARIALAAGTALALLALAEGLGRVRPTSDDARFAAGWPGEALLSFGLGAIGASVCTGIGQWAKRRARRHYDVTRSSAGTGGGRHVDRIGQAR